MAKIQLSPQQQAFIDWCRDGRGSAVLEAVAGAGKTTTILEAVDVIHGGCAILAFNKEIANEIKARLTKRGVDWKKAQAGTVHSFGFNAYRKAFPQVKVNEHKVADMIEAAVERGELQSLRAYLGVIAKLIGLAKQRAVGILGRIDNRELYRDIIDHFDLLDDAEDDDGRPCPVELIVTAAIKFLGLSNVRTSEIDFDDMVYLPLIHKCRFWQFDNVFVDEAQDTNPARRALVRALVRKGGRVIAVGDPCQPLGTQVSVPVFNTRWQRNEPSTVAIEALSIGDKVVSYQPADCAFVPNGRSVNGVARKAYDGDLIVVTDETGRISRYTPHHRCYVNAEALRAKTAVYLMRKGDQFRVGKCRLDYAHSTGLSARMRDEGADAAWILSLHDSMDEAFFQEQAIAGRFGLPQLMFNPKKMLRGPSKDYLPAVWEFIGSNVGAADMCLTRFRLDIRYPIFEARDGYLTLKRPMVVRAVNLIDGMKMLPYTGAVHVRKSDWTSIRVTRQRYSDDVISLDVAGSKLYVADGLLTRNCQAIYGFTGADSDALDLIAADFNCRRMPLTVTYRCPKAVVKFARQWVDHIEAHPSAPEGSIGQTTFLDFVERKDLDGSAAILCRNTKPLVAAAFALIRRKIACRIEGREIGESLSKLATKWTSIKTINALETKLTAYLDRETTKLLAKKQEQKLQAIEDKVETLRVIAERCREEGKTQITDVVAYIKELFADSVTGILTLSTIHRSKGREWNRVFWLDRVNTCPSKYARQAWQQAAEVNLMYVAATRAQAELIDLEAPPEKMPAPQPVVKEAA